MRIGGLALGAALLAACAVSPGPQSAAAPTSPPPSATAPTESRTPTPVATPSPSPSASPTPFTAPSGAPPPSPLPSAAAAEPVATPGPTPPPGTTPFPTPGPTITPGSTRVIGTLTHGNGSPAAGVCVVLEIGICPIATDEQGVWFTDIPAGPIRWNFIYKVAGEETGRQFVLSTAGGELRLPLFRLPD